MNDRTEGGLTATGKLSAVSAASLESYACAHACVSTCMKS